MKLEKLIVGGKLLSAKVSGISSESQSEIVSFVADNAKSEYENIDFGTTIVIKSNVEAFIAEWEA